ncbi:hypothetical protein ABIB35_001189 [Arthrobacter sp. UYP6]|uniref:serine hydrolase n=1 Tax=Arthrobacter sp. UYP6 TaxID=1756378 RepID=UPI003399C0A1
MHKAFKRPFLRHTLAAGAALLLPLAAGCTAPPAADSVPTTIEAPSEAAGPDSLPAPESDLLNAAMNEYSDTVDADFSAAVYERTTGRVWYYNAEGSYLEASLVKVPILLTLLRQASDEERGLTLEEEYLAVMMIEYSDNDATTALYEAVGGAPELARTYELLGVTETDATEIWGANDTDVEDQLEIARAVLEGVDWINADLQAFAVELMENVESGQSWGISAGVSELGAEIALKNGWLQDDDFSWNVGSMGFVRADGAEYAVVVLTSGTETMEDGVSVVEQVAGIINSFEATGTPGTGDTETPMWRAERSEA